MRYVWKHALRSFGAFFFIAAIVGCDAVKNWVGEQDSNSIEAISSTLSGQVDDLIPTGSQSTQSVCNEGKAYLFKLDRDGNSVQPFEAQTDIFDGRFNFTNLKSELEIRKSSVGQPLLVQADQCGELYSGLVTGSQNQRLNNTSAMLASFLNTENAAAIVEKIKSDKGKSHRQLILAAQELATSNDLIAKLKTDFKPLFEAFAGEGADPDDLLNAVPFVFIAKEPTVLIEGQPAAFAVRVKHWNSAYHP